MTEDMKWVLRIVGFAVGYFGAALIYVYWVTP